MMHRLCFLPIVASLCLAASGCQSEMPASATNGSNPRPPSSNRSTAPFVSGEPTASGDGLGQNSKPVVDSKSGNASHPLAGVPKSIRAIPITFDDLQLEMKEDAVFRPSLLTARVKQLDGQRVRIRGFIFPSVFQQTGITRFPLVKNTECKFGPGGVAHHIILVDLQPGLSTSFTVRPITVEGLLSVRPFDGPDGKTWTVYHMVGDMVD